MNVRILKRTDHSVSARRLINSSATCPWKVSLSALDEMKAKNLTKINKNCSMNTKIFGRKQQRHSYANKIMVKNTFTLLDSSNRWNLCLSYQIKQFTNEKTIYLLVNLAGGGKKKIWKKSWFCTLCLSSSASSLWRLSLGGDFPDLREAPWTTDRNKHLPSPGIPVP